jgi:imidazolonepropionase
MPHSKNILISNIKTVVGVMTEPYSLKKGKAQSIVDTLDDAYILIENGLIKDYGPMQNVPQPTDCQIIDAKDRYVCPTWCDSHSHLVFAGSREQEFVSRLKGKSYQQISEEGGGILNSAIKLQNTSEDDLYESASTRLRQVISTGTGAIEIKSGYGLTTDSELKMLRVIKRLNENFSVTIKASFLGAHAIPIEYKNNRQEYIDLIINEMLPQVAEQGLAEYCDVFCDKGFYTVQETDQILTAAHRYGLKPKIHANELANSGGVQIGIKHNAISVDHLEEIEEEEIRLLSQSATIPTLLPSCSFFLNIPYGPARRLIDAGAGVCLATDYNPGTSPSGNVPFLMSLGSLKMKMLPNETFNAVTINGACAMELQDTLGSISKGKKANLIITQQIPSFEYITYSFGRSVVYKVLLEGKEVYTQAT